MFQGNVAASEYIPFSRRNKSAMTPVRGTMYLLIPFEQRERARERARALHTAAHDREGAIFKYYKNFKFKSSRNAVS